MEISKENEPARSFEIAEEICDNECRVCMEKCSETYEIFRSGGEIPQKIMAVAAVQVEEGDGLPNRICLPCYQRLDISYNFKFQVQNSDEKLRHVLRLKLACENNDKNSQVTEVQLPQDVINTIESDHSTVLELDVPDYGKDQNVFIPQNVENNIHSSERNCNRDTLNSEVNPNEFYQNNSVSQNYRTQLCVDIVNNETCQPSISTRDSYVKLESSFVKNEKESSLFIKNGNVSSSLVGENEANVPVSSEENDNENENDVVLDESEKLVNDNMEVRLGTNCSDDEKPLISRTTRQKCPHCIKSFATKLALQRHTIVHKHKTKLRYVCHVCDKQFSNISKLKNHVFTNHENNHRKEETSQEIIKANRKEINKIEEKKVSKAANAKNGPIESTKTEKKNFKYTCKVCSKQFTYQKSFLSHAKTHPEYKVKGDNKPKQETSVFKESESEEEDTEDEEDEEDDDDGDLPIESLQCTQCGKLFATKRNLKRHISTHSGLKFNCSTCGKAFSRADKLKDHVQSKHKEELFGNSDDNAENDTDNENKINESSENRKKDKHNRPHKCAMCPKAFAQAQSLSNHIERHKRVKDTQKRFLCEVCSKCFAQSGSLVAHMRTHTGVKPYVCNVCSRAFTKSTYLQLHLRTHSGEKPYICQYCSRAFARANTLARHITMHTGEAKYHCQICTKSFRRLTSLNEHTYTHTGQRPYACKICTKRYNNAGSLYAHTKKCKAQQLSSNTQGFTVSMENSTQQNGQIPQVLIYSQRKLLEDATVGQITPTPQYMIPNVHNQKSLPTNIIQPFSVEDPNVYAVNSKQFKNPYYAIYPNM